MCPSKKCDIRDNYVTLDRNYVTLRFFSKELKEMNDLKKSLSPNLACELPFWANLEYCGPAGLMNYDYIFISI